VKVKNQVQAVVSFTETADKELETDFGLGLRRKRRGVGGSVYFTLCILAIRLPNNDESTEDASCWMQLDRRFDTGTKQT